MNLSKYHSLKSLVSATLGMKVSQFAETVGMPERTLRDWFKDETKHKALGYWILGIQKAKGW
ncbi:TPA: hypothetical protein P0E18_004485 [Vibrio harveyi]|nr:hypothetical protein [Vibrio harveyi]